jgi:hypothetical protein
VHPIERLRWIARAHDEAPSALAVEAAWTISELAADEPAAVVTACRRLVEAHVTLGPIWWVAARLLVASDADLEAKRAVDQFLGDPTADLLADGLGDRFPATAVIVVSYPTETVAEALSYRPSAVVRVVGASSHGRRAEVRKLESLVGEASGWDLDETEGAVQGAAVVLLEALAAGPGGVVVSAGTARLAQAAREASVPLWAVAGVGRVLGSQLLAEMQRRADGAVELVGTDSLEVVAGPGGIEDPPAGLSRSDCPFAPELLVTAG